jgi:hypothetical protein
MLLKNPQNLQENKATATQARHFDVDITTSVTKQLHMLKYVAMFSILRESAFIMSGGGGMKMS